MGICYGVCEQQAKNIVNQTAIVTETIKQGLQEDTIISAEIEQEKRYFHMETCEIYEGDIVNGIRNGKGRQIWPDGNFINDMADGKGILVNSEGNVYEGEWLEDEASILEKLQP
ncbi:unnamed protein product [Paramecium sonneborni]|uniref:MORN repeat protein n=1 Tax=Paramecium sonneborni TaxID=65129 RepID=A0A8S1N093_9CILI|nr:unnamed protein product [Paramecium sonneborni]